MARMRAQDSKLEEQNVQCSKPGLLSISTRATLYFSVLPAGRVHGVAGRTPYLGLVQHVGLCGGSDFHPAAFRSTVTRLTITLR